MKRTFLWLGCGILAAGMAFAQDASSSGASGSQDQNTQTRTRSTTTQNNTVRGCLSGSPGNYTITDQNGTQWTVTGDDATLRSSVGRAVEIAFTQHQSSDESSQGATTTRTTHSVQASQVTALSDTCDAGSGLGAPSNNANPGGTSGSAEPSSPRMMSMLMQQSMPGQSQNGTSSQPQATPPVSSQTPATSTSPTSGSSSQVGTSPANNSGMSEGQANPQTGQTAGSGVSNQGVNNSGTTNPNATPASPNSATPSANAAPTSPDSATPPSNAPQPQSSANDQNKPLYERQATDIPWAKSSGSNTGTPPPQQ